MVRIIPLVSGVHRKLLNNQKTLLLSAADLLKRDFLEGIRH